MSDAIHCTELDRVLPRRHDPGCVSLPVRRTSTVEATYEARVVGRNDLAPFFERVDDELADIRNVESNLTNVFGEAIRTAIGMSVESIHRGRSAGEGRRYREILRAAGGEGRQHRSSDGRSLPDVVLQISEEAQLAWNEPDRGHVGDIRISARGLLEVHRGGALPNAELVGDIVGHRIGEDVDVDDRVRWNVGFRVARRSDDREQLRRRASIGLLKRALRQYQRNSHNQGCEWAPECHESSLLVIAA